MLNSFLSYFSKRHFLTNFLVIAVFVGGILAWQNTKKEEMPDVTFERIHISTGYPGAPAADVEYFVTQPIEEVVRGLDGVHQVTSSSSTGNSSISVELEPNYPDLDEALNDIRNEVSNVDLPDDITEDPRVRIFKTSKKAIIDIALIDKNAPMLDYTSRLNLQEYALALENALVDRKEINSVNKKNYLQKEIQINVLPEKLKEYKIPFNTIMNEVKNNHIRKPAGSVQTREEPKVTLLSELNTVEKLNNLVIQSGFEGGAVRLSQTARVEEAFEKSDSIVKVNGHEAIMFSVVKNSSYGILEALNAIRKVTDQFQKNALKDCSIELVLLDDESVDLRNRLSLISINGIIGFVLVLITLFLFLNMRSGIWVAMGIPFTFCFTMLFGYLLGYTINGTTLAAVIIVMGIVVDDAIVVAENINRLTNKGLPRKEAVIEGTRQVLLPIIASIVTTCIAFIPLYFFEGRHGKFVQFIPPVIFLMLGASLFESVFILPGHLDLDFSFFKKMFRRKEKVQTEPVPHWFEKAENAYGRILEKILPLKWVIFGIFITLLVVSCLLVQTKMKFVMFPQEETREIVISGKTQNGMMKYETAQKVSDIEKKILPYIGKEVIGFRTGIARSRRGGAVEENTFRMVIEIVPKEKRKKSADKLLKELEQSVQGLEGFQKLKFQKSRWGQSSGSAIELRVQQNNDDIRKKVVDMLMEKMRKDPNLASVEMDQGYEVTEYRVSINHEKIKRLSINPSDISSTFRAALEGTILYDFPRGDEEVDVRFSTVEEAKDDIEKILDLPVENRSDYLVPLRNIVSIEEIKSPNNISRRNLKRETIVDAALAPKTKKTPLDIAAYYEKDVFPELLSQYPTTTLSFGGEIEDTRDSQADLTRAVVLVVFLIYIVLAILFNCLYRPLIIMLAIPFGIVGVVLAFWLHGKILFGFFAAVGVLGLAGVVINDSIIMLAKLDNEYDTGQDSEKANKQIADISQTRLRAVILTTLTTVAGVLPTAYGFAGYDAMLAEMMLALTWGLMFGTLITLILIPCIYSALKDFEHYFSIHRGEHS